MQLTVQADRLSVLANWQWTNWFSGKSYCHDNSEYLRCNFACKKLNISFSHPVDFWRSFQIPRSFSRFLCCFPITASVFVTVVTQQLPPRPALPPSLPVPQSILQTLTLVLVRFFKDLPIVLKYSICPYNTRKL